MGTYLTQKETVTSCLWIAPMLLQVSVSSGEKKENLMMAWVDVTIAHCNDTKLNIMASNMVLESII